MITVRIGKKMYDVTKRCPICSEEKVILSKYSDRLICTCCENWIYINHAVGTSWVKESEK